MFLLDTDILSLLARQDPQVTARAEAATELIAITVVTRVEILRARFAFLLKAADGDELQRAQYWLDRSESDLDSFPLVRVDGAAAAEFDELRQHKRLKKIGRADLLIAGIALANDATLVTRNLRHFQQVPHIKLENWASP